MAAFLQDEPAEVDVNEIIVEEQVDTTAAD
jgi:hypothetical protein